MEMRLRLHRWEGRSPDLVAAAVAGIAAGAVLMVLELLWAATMMGEAPWRISQFVAAITMGPYTVLHSPPNVFDPTIVTVALVTHYVLGISFAIVLGAVVAGYHYDDDVNVSLPVIGGVFGALLYLFNFFALTQVYPWFAELRGWGTFAAHVVFGITAAELYGMLARSRRQRRAGGR